MKKFQVGQEVFVVYDSLMADRKQYNALRKIKSISEKRGDITLEDFHTTFDRDGYAKNKVDRWSRGPWIELATPELKADLKVRKIRQDRLGYLREFKWDSLNDEKLKRITDILLEA